MSYLNSFSIMGSYKATMIDSDLVESTRPSKENFNLRLSVYSHIFFETLIVFLESTIKLITRTFDLQK